MCCSDQTKMSWYAIDDCCHDLGKKKVSREYVFNLLKTEGYFFNFSRVVVDLEYLLNKQKRYTIVLYIIMNTYYQI